MYYKIDNCYEEYKRKTVLTESDIHNKHHIENRNRTTPPRNQRYCISTDEKHTLCKLSLGIIPRNRWLRLNMTEKLFTGTLNHNQNKTKQIHVLQNRQLL